MNIGKQHQMVMVQEHEDGMQEWLCPVCGRRFLMRWPLNYKRTILEPGDEEAIHTGGTGGVQMGGAEFGPVEIPEPESADEPAELYNMDDPYLAPFQRFIENHQF